MKPVLNDASRRATLLDRFVVTRRVRAFWQQASISERRGLASAGGMVILALIWWLGLSPALATLRTAEGQHRALDAQLQVMRDLAAQAGNLQSLPKIGFEESRAAVDASVKQQLGAAAQVSLQGDRAVVTLKNAAPQALAAWLTQTRANARTVPLEAQLRQNAARSGWDGSVVLGLPPP